jgi:methionine sulfoxide reductase catalytic subunit
VSSAAEEGTIMQIRVPGAHEVRESEVTPEAVYLRRRELIAGAALGAAALTWAGAPRFSRAEEDAPRPPRLGTLRSSRYSEREQEPTSWDDVTHHNNFYEFGTDKGDPAVQSRKFVPRPWSVAIEGEVASPGSMPLETLLAPHPLEERIYRLRCVETWAMVVPWVGFPLGDLLKRLEPTSKARYVELRTLRDPERMPGQKRNVLDWPYREGLRMDEAMHPLTILAVGLYGRELPNQNGAPLRLVVPWKYGFKSIKSIVSIGLREKQPETTWSMAAPDEYGFYANVNPAVDHPRWSQKRERRIGATGLSNLLPRATQPFNGYGELVADLYRGMDLKRDF